MKEAQKTDRKLGTEQKKVGSSGKYLTFSLCSQLYGIPTSHVTEIIRMQKPTFLPNLPDYIKGVINLRGKVVPVIDMRLRFREKTKAWDSHTSIVIVEDGENTAGLIVDSVEDVRNVEEDRITGAPKPRKNTGGFVRGIATLEGGSAMLLDLTKVLSAGSLEEKTENGEENERGSGDAGRPSP